MGLTAIVLTTKDPKEIKSTTDSVTFADEIIILRDGVGEDVKRGKIEVKFHKLNHDFAAHRNYALSKAKNDWVLFVDDDEVVSEGLQKEILTAIESDNFVGFAIPRIDMFHNQILQHGETGSMSLIRLGRKSAGKFVRSVHEIWKLDGIVGNLENNLIHKRGNLTTSFLDRISFYGPIDAAELLRENKPFTYWRLLLYPKAKFILNYFIKLGFLDGTLGLFHAYLMSVQSLSVRIFQWEKI